MIPPLVNYSPEENNSWVNQWMIPPLVNYSPEEKISWVNQWMIPQWWTIHLRRTTVEWISEWFPTGELFTWGENQFRESVYDSPVVNYLPEENKQLSESVNDSPLVNYSPAGENQFSESVNDSPLVNYSPEENKQLSESVNDSPMVNYSPVDSRWWVNSTSASWRHWHNKYILHCSEQYRYTAVY